MLGVVLIQDDPWGWAGLSAALRYFSSLSSLRQLQDLIIYFNFFLVGCVVVSE